jgi:hypothetical protein
MKSRSANPINKGMPAKLCLGFVLLIALSCAKDDENNIDP